MALADRVYTAKYKQSYSYFHHWFHYTMVYNGANEGITLYVNNKAAKTSNEEHKNNEDFTRGNGHIVLGRLWTREDQGSYASVALDELKIWNSKLTLEQAKKVYQG